SGTGKLYKSTNRGISWSITPTIPRRQSNQTLFHYRAVALSPHYAIDRTLFLATFDGLWKSANGGNSWHYSEILPTHLVRSMSISPTLTRDQTVLASTYGSSMIRTQNGGASWDILATGLVNGYPDPTSLAPDFGVRPLSFIGTVWGPHKSTNGGDTWALIEPLDTPMFARAVAISPNYDQDYTVAIGVDNAETGHPPTVLYNGQPVSTYGVFMSRSAGLNWTPTQVNGIGIHSVAFSPNYADDQTMFAASLYNEGLHKSTDEGLTWQTLSNTIPTDCCLSRVLLSPQYAIDQTLFVIRATGPVEPRGLYKSTDGGATWTRTAGSESSTLLDFALSPNYATDSTLFLATLERGLLKSTDGGATLEPTGFDGAYVTALEISPDFTSDQTLFLASYLGIFK
ncbi:MAG: WD40/YVTN/BNR-like repeat-containing protein, partial [Candidatus Binatia bacterium]